MKSIDINEIDNLDLSYVIDIRQDYEVAEVFIHGTTHIEMNELILNHTKYLDKQKTYYIMCRSGMRSVGLINELERHGYDLVNLEHGILGYDH